MMSKTLAKKMKEFPKINSVYSCLIIQSCVNNCSTIPHHLHNFLSSPNVILNEVGSFSTRAFVFEVTIKAYAMKALVSRAGAGAAQRVGTSDWWSFSVGYFLNLIQIICVQSFYLLIWGKKRFEGRPMWSY
jgi:hypothetical protein